MTRARSEPRLSFFKLDVDRYLADEFVRDMAPLEELAHLRLMLYAWREGGVLPWDPRKLARMARAKHAAQLEA